VGLASDAGELFETKMVMVIMIRLSEYCGEVDFLSLLLLLVMVLRYSTMRNAAAVDSSTSLSTVSSALFFDPYERDIAHFMTGPHLLLTI